MKTIARRDKLKIIGDLLSALNANAGTKIFLSQIASKINVPYDRLKVYLKDIKELGLIENEQSLILTEKGKTYIKESKRVLDFVTFMGLAYTQFFLNSTKKINR